MKDLPILLKELDAVLKQYNPINYSKLLPPLPKKEMDAFLEKLGIDDDDIRDIFECKNGVDVSDGLDVSEDFLDFGVLYPLQAILRSVNLHPDEYSQALPLISNAAGDRLLFNNKLGSEYGQFFLESTSNLSLDDEMFSLYDSAYSMIESNIRFYIEKAFVFDMTEQRLIKDIDKYSRI